MAEPTKPKAAESASAPGGGNIHKLLALIEKWQAEPGDYDERAAAAIDPTIAERRLALRTLNWDWKADDE